MGLLNTIIVEARCLNLAFETSGIGKRLVGGQSYGSGPRKLAGLYPKRTARRCRLGGYSPGRFRYVLALKRELLGTTRPC